MPFNGSGIYSLPAGNPVVTGTTISSSWANSTLSDIGTALTACLTKSGESTPTANIPMGTFKLTGMGVGSAATDSVTLGQAQAAAFAWCGTSGGSANAQTLTPSPAITAYAAGQTFRFKAGYSNAGATTLAISGLATIALQANGAACVGGEVVANQFYEITLDTTSTAQLLRIGTAAGAGSITASGYSMTTARLLGRTTASTGAIEEISVAASLTLNAGSLSGTAATTTQAGVAELLTQAEYDAATDTTRVPTANLNRIALKTAVPTTSGTAWGFTGVPAGSQRLALMFNGWSTNGTSAPLIQLGDSGGYENSGYLGAGSIITTAVSTTNFTTGFGTTTGVEVTLHGTVYLERENTSSNTWECSGTLYDSAAARSYTIGGKKSLSGELDRIQLTTVGGTDAGDAGEIALSVER